MLGEVRYEYFWSFIRFLFVVKNKKKYICVEREYDHPCFNFAALSGLRRFIGNSELHQSIGLSGD